MTESEHTENPKHLKEVISTIPESCYDNPTWKGMWYVFRDLLMYGAMVALLLSTDNFWYLIPLWLLAGFVVSALFIIGHDAGHRALFKKKWMCDWVGRVTMLPSFHNYSGWLLGHNRIHHGFTVHQERDFVWHPYSPEEYAGFSRWRKLLHRLEWSCFGAGIYYLIEVWWKKMMVLKPPKNWVRDIRKDRLFLVAGLILGAGFFAFVTVFFKGEQGASAVGYFVWLCFKVMIVPWFLFNYSIGAVVYLHHINPELKWHEHKAWSRFKAQMEGTMIFRVSPKFLDIFYHHIMIHVPHHVDARIPFYNLDKAAKHLHDKYPGVVRDVPLRLRDYVRATRLCKLYDFETETWLDYEGNPFATMNTPSG
jgi:omega-6 fatty acid desaturase (delta-12 desaturase)